MEIVYSAEAQEDILFWKNSGNVKTQKRIVQIIGSIQETPFAGIGKPEALKYNWSGYWSRRINKEHRLIYKVENEIVYVVSLKDHY